MNKLATIHIFALAALGGGISGGDRIFMEFARRWSEKISVNIYVWEEGLRMCQREDIKGPNLKIKLIKVGNFSRLGFVLTYFYRIFLGLKLGLTLQIQDGTYVYSASEFWMDSIPALILKLRNPKINWVAAWYQTAPNPLKGFSEGGRKNLYRLSAFFYWFMQQPVKPLITKFADFILVNNEFEKKQFKQIKAKIIVVIGAVKIEDIIQYQKKHPVPTNKKYLAVFQGRFHPQKGAIELIDIWKLVTKKIPHAKLAMIGDGPLMNRIKEKIKKLNLEKNIELFGYLHDGDKKYSIFNNSKIVVHPSFYDSGGMAAAEAMAFGLPAVGFDLKAYSSYYPEGMIKVTVGDLKAFAKKILELNKNENLYNQLGQSAKEWVYSHFSWNKRANEVRTILKIKMNS